MFDPRAAAATAGLAVELIDLGDWQPARLISEYDRRARAIRINVRAVEAFGRTCGASVACELRYFFDLAIAHELYHHREATGEVARLPNLRQRESAADAYARASVPVSARLAAFVGHRAAL